MKKRIKLILFFGIIFILAGVIAFQALSTNLSGRAKFDFGGSQRNAISTNFIQRFISGIQPVSKYTSSSYSGRFGILNDITIPPPINISDCGNLDITNQVYTLNRSVNSTGTCFTVLANNVTLNCDGYKINYSRTTNGNAVRNKGFNTTTVKECNIFQGSLNRVSSYALNFTNEVNSTFNRNNITISGTSKNYGIYLSNSSNNNVTNNEISTKGTTGYSIYLNGNSNNTYIIGNILNTSAASVHSIYVYKSSNSRIEFNNITTIGNSAYAVYLVESNKNNITSNNLTTGGSSSYVVNLQPFSDNNKIMSNNITFYGSSARGIHIQKVLNTEISLNIININKSSVYGIYLDSSNYSIIDKNNITLRASGDYGLYLSASTSNNITNNHIYTENTGISTGRGIYLVTSNSSQIINNTVEVTSTAFTIASGSSNVIYNNIFNTTATGIVTIINVASNVNKLNTTKTDLTPNKNIILGDYLAGNQWENSPKTGFSQTCSDGDGDGICDANYTINAYNLDYLPLTKEDNVPPIVEIWSPENKSFVNGRVTIRANASDNFAVKNVLFQYKNSSISWTNLLACNDTTAPYTCLWNTLASLYSNSSEGYDIKAIAYDGQGNTGEAINHYTLDRNKPIVYEMDVIYPAGQTSVRNTQDLVLSTLVTDSPFVGAGINITQANLSYINSTQWADMQFVSGSLERSMNSTWQINVSVSSTTGIPKLVAMRVYDNATPTNNLRTGDLWEVRIDNDAPTYNSLSSSGTTYNYTTATFGINVNENYLLKKYIFSQNSSGLWENDSAILISEASYPISYDRIVYTGNFSYKFYIFDDAGNMNETSTGDIEVLGNIPIPFIYLISPLDGAITNNPSVTFSYQYINSALDNCSLTLDTINNETTASPASDTVLTFSKTLVDGPHTWYVSCYKIEEEGENNILREYQSDIYALNIDTISPVITIESPENTTYQTSTTYINVSTNEDAGWCGYSLDSATNVTMTETNSTYYLSSLLLTPKFYALVVSCNDTANNFGSASKNFTIAFRNVKVNLTSPLNNAEIARGNNLVDNEDDKGVVSDSLDIYGKFYDSDTNAGLGGATCYFFLGNNQIGADYTNSTGDCNISYDKSSITPGTYSVKVNYSYLVEDTNQLENESNINLSIAQYIASLSANPSHSTKYYDGELATLTITISKTNATGTSNYDPQNLTANATTSAGNIYPGGILLNPSNITKTSTGIYTTNITVNYTFSALLKWNVWVTDNSFVEYISSAVHEDIGICSNAGWGAWGACVAGVKTRTDSSGCTETIACGEPPPDSCFPGYTLVTMGDKSKKEIKDIKIGEEVLSYDLKENKLVNAKVLETESPIREGLYEINGFLNVTDEHPLYTMKKDGSIGWAAINKTKAEKDLKASSIGNQEILTIELGDKLFTSEGKWVEIKNIEYFPGEIQTYNLKIVDKYNTFFANDVLAHNKGGTCTSTCSPSGSIDSTCVTNSTLRTRTCGNYDEDSCLEWGEEEYNNCPLGEICENANCTTAVCQEDWRCSAWSECVSGTQTRICLDNNKCGTTKIKPSELQQCEICEENWQCEWTICEEGDVYSEPYDCVDLNSCGTVSNEPSKVNCSDRPEEICYDESGQKIHPNWQCAKWQTCEAKYDLSDVLLDTSFVEGYKKRACHDLTGCKNNKIEKKLCDLFVPIEARKTEWCNESYVEIYNKETNTLVSRINEKEIIGFKNLTRIDISFPITQFVGYCDYCFDGIQNYGETGVDCGGENCPECLRKYGFFDWLFWVILILWILFFILLFIYWKRKEEKEKQIIKEGIIGKAEKVMGILKPISKEEEKEKERKIAYWFKNFRLPKIRFEKTRVEKPEKIRIEKKLVIQKSPEESLLSKLKRKLAFWKEEGYAGTAKLEGEIERAKIGVHKKEKSFVRKIITSYKIKREDRKREKHIKKIRKKLESEIKRKKKEAEKGAEKQKKVRVKERKRKIRILKREIRNRKILDLMRKLKIWRREGYYGTSKLEEELKKLKEYKD
jgi:hypothetical protein